MTYSLVIVESPAKCKKIESYLGAGYRCMASFGHLRFLQDLKSIDFDLESSRAGLNLAFKSVVNTSSTSSSSSIAMTTSITLAPQTPTVTCVL